MKVYGKPNCPNCELAKTLLEFTNTPYEYVDVHEDETALQFLLDQGIKSVPQIYLDSGQRLGGVNELKHYL